MPVRLKAEDSLWEAVKRLANEQGESNLVQAGFDVPNESLTLESVSKSSVSDLATEISSAEPRFSFYRHVASDGTCPILFIYTCPLATKVHDRMLYATARRSVIWTAQQATGVVVVKTIEASDPDDIPEKIEWVLQPQ
ncbi:actin depolymerizing protein [Delitschia confertaspora ATCC 74209]|uniref:Actin depolymerizing protein n=1 Tax=Delitschia confertaspora ATCC 74209 TaxID=1513339 RepID=A0A9P4JI35_9PLEO|nr:actin depolymerizing protein [Delitschia confertaspora ATCC 74209]